MKKSCVLKDVLRLGIKAAGTDLIEFLISSIEGTMVEKNQHEQ